MNKIKLSEIRELVRKTLNESEMKPTDKSCWKGYKKVGTKKNAKGETVNDCRKITEEDCSECDDKNIEEGIDIKMIDHAISNEKDSTQKNKLIKLSEIRELVKNILKEESDKKYNIIDVGADLDGENKNTFAFGIIKPLKKIMIFKNYGSAARIYSYFYKKYNLKPVDGNKFTVIHSGTEIDKNKIPKKYSKFEIV